MTMTKWAPLREFMSLRDVMDKLVDESFVPPKLFSADDGWMPIDLYETPEKFTLKTPMPGVTAAEIEIEATAQQITIRGEHKEEAKLEEGTKVRRELRYGKYERTIAMPIEIDPDKVDATFENGLLVVTLPKSEVVKPKTVKIKTAK